MQLANLKNFTKLYNSKNISVKTGVFVTLAAYWAVILVGTFITFN